MIGFRAAFGENDVRSAAQVFRRLAEGAAWQEVFITERGLAVHEDDVHAMAETLVLETVVEEQHIRVEMAKGVQTAFDAVFVHEHADTGEVFGQHVWFIAGAAGIEEDLFAIRDDARWEQITIFKHLIAQALGEGAWDAFVSAAEDRDTASAILQFTGEHFGDGGFAGAADGKVADAGYGATDFLWAKNARAVEGEACLHGALVGVGEEAEEELEGIGASAFLAFEDDIHRVTFESFEENAH